MNEQFQFEFPEKSARVQVAVQQLSHNQSVIFFGSSSKQRCHHSFPSALKNGDGNQFGGLGPSLRRIQCLGETTRWPLNSGLCPFQFPLSLTNTHVGRLAWSDRADLADSLESRPRVVFRTTRWSSRPQIKSNPISSSLGGSSLRRRDTKMGGSCQPH